MSALFVGAAASLVVIALLFVKVSHILSLLVCLEFVFLLIVGLLFISCNCLSADVFYLTFFIATAASESAVSLCIYVLISRFYSKDYVVNLFTAKI